MHVSTVTTTDQTLLRAVRETITSANDLLFCVAFVHEKGLRLLEDELDDANERGARARLVVTTVFEQNPDSALAVAYNHGLKVRVLNPGSGSTYHPKVYLGGSGKRSRAVIGSANLTGGLATNLEVGVTLDGARTDAPIDEAWTWAEAMWNDPRATPWQPGRVAEAKVETLHPQLLTLIAAAKRVDRDFRTLGPRPATNRVTDVTPTAVYVETARSRRERGTPQEVPAWMFNLAWEHLTTHGSLSNTTLLNVLRVHRSSAVCAILARLPGVEVGVGRKIVLSWRGAGTVG